MNTGTILDLLSDIRSKIPQAKQERPETHGNARGPGAEPDALADFEGAALADALESMADDLGAAIAERQANLLAQCLEIYYATEELSRDPAHADLIPRVEEMRRAFEQSYGKPIPPRELSRP